MSVTGGDLNVADVAALLAAALSCGVLRSAVVRFCVVPTAWF